MSTTLKRAEIFSKLNEHPTETFGLTYLKLDGTVRSASARLHVQNPTHGTKPGQGTRKGRSAKEAAAAGDLLYFDMTKVTPDGRGAFRTAKLDRVLKIVAHGVEYLVED